MKIRVTPVKILANLDIAVACVVLCAVVAITFLGVVFRYVLNKPFMWMEEAQLMCMVWLVYGAAGAAFRLRSHVIIEMLVDLFPQKAQKAVEIFVGIVILCAILYFFIQSIGYVQLFIMNRRVSGILRIPYRYVYAIVPLSCVLMIVNFIVSFFSSRRHGELREQNNE